MLDLILSPHGHANDCSRPVPGIAERCMVAEEIAA